MGHKIKVTSVFVASLLFRFLPFRAPNVELILASQMPVAKTYGGLAGFFFGAFSILAFDLITGTLGAWSLITAPAYGLLGLGAAWYFKHRSQKRHFVYFAIGGTLFYDALTGLTVGPLFFHQPFFGAVVGQIPFTLMHLLGNVSFSLIWSPFIEKWMTQKSPITISLPALELRRAGKLQTNSKFEIPNLKRESSYFYFGN